MYKRIILQISILLSLGTSTKLIAQIDTIFYAYDKNIKALKLYDTVSDTSDATVQKLISQNIKSIQNQGYITAGIDSLKRYPHKIECFIFVGNRYTLQNVVADSMSEKDFKKAGIKLKALKGKTLTPKIINQITHKLVYYNACNAYPFCTAQPKIQFLDTQSVILNFDIQRNKKIFFGDIKIKGNVKNSPKFIANLLDIHKGKPYNEKLIDNVETKTSQLEYISTIRKPALEFKGYTADLYLYMNSRTVGQFSGIIGLQPDTVNDNKMSFTGNIDFDFKNLLKHAETISLHWKRIKSGSQNLTVKLKYPYIFALPLEPLGALEIDKVQSSYINLETKLGVAYIFPNNDKLPVSYSHFASKVLNAKGQTSIQDVSHNFLNIGYQSKHLDYIFNPANGYEINAIIGKGIRNLAEKKSSIYKANINITYFKSIYKKLVLKLISQHQSIFSNSTINQNEMLKFGGYKSMRGFDEEQFFAEKTLRTALEIRFLYEKKSAAYLFYDSGFMFQKSQKTQFLQGMGMGVELSTKAGKFNFSYAIGKEQGKKLQLLDTKIHISFINKF